MNTLSTSGIKFAKNPKEDEIIGPVQCYALDRDRDEELGYPLSQYNLNYFFDPPDVRDRLFKSTLLKEIDPNSLPSEVDLRPVWGDILDQGSLGSCVSNSVVYQLRHLLKKTGQSADIMSRLFIYYNGRVQSNFPINEDSGLTMRSGFRSVASFGSLPETSYPYVISKFAVEPSDAIYKVAANNKNLTYLSVGQNLSELKKCLKDGYAISFGIALFDSFMTVAVARTGMVPIPNENREKRIGGHAITIVGYDNSLQCFVISNSWGKSWGDKGYGYVPYSYVLNKNYSGDFWTPRSYFISPSPTPAPAPSPPSPSVKDWAPNILYKKADVANYLGKSYRCLISHKSLNMWTPVAVPALWRRG